MADIEKSTIKFDRWTLGHLIVGAVSGLACVPWWVALSLPLVPLLVDRNRKAQPVAQLATDWAALGAGYVGGRVVRAVVVPPSSTGYLVFEGDDGQQYALPAVEVGGDE